MEQLSLRCWHGAQQSLLVALHQANLPSLADTVCTCAPRETVVTSPQTYACGATAPAQPMAAWLSWPTVAGKGVTLLPDHPGPLHRLFANASIAGRLVTVSSCHSTQYPASGDAVVTVLSTTSEWQPVDSAAGWTYVGKDDGEAGSRVWVEAEWVSSGGCLSGNWKRFEAAACASSTRASRLRAIAQCGCGPMQLSRS